MSSDNYFETKYKLFIKTWQTSDTVEEVRRRLAEDHGWYYGMDSAVCPHSWPSETYFPISAVRSYMRRLRKKGVPLKVMQEDSASEIRPTDYEMLADYARTTGGRVGE
jgi:hypothetical protein